MHPAAHLPSLLLWALLSGLLSVGLVYPSLAQASPTQATTPAASNANTAPANVTPKQASAQWQSLLNRLPSSVQTGYVVQDLSSGTVLEEQEGSTAFIPASTMKILVAQATMHSRGNGGFWSTELTHSAEQEGQAKLHTLTLRGNGDPTLRLSEGPNSLRALAQQAYKRGVREVQQVRMADGSRQADEFATLRLGQSLPALRLLEWEDNPPSTAVQARARLGAALIAELRRAGIRVQTDSVSSVPEQKPYISAAKYDEQGQLLPPDMVIPLAERPEVAVASVRGQQVTEYVAGMLRPSDNQRAEILLATLEQPKPTLQGRPVQSPQDMAPEASSLMQARQTLADFVARQGLYAAGVKIGDGSGLSEDNRLPPRTLTDALQLWYDLPYLSAKDAQTPKQPQAWFAEGRNLFVQALPKAGAGGPKTGIGGTMAQRLQGSGLVVHAKTGTLMGVSCLAGYVVSQQGRPLAFAIMMNGPETSPILQMRAIQDEMVKVLARVY